MARYENIPVIVVLAIVGIAMFQLNQVVPRFADDYCRSLLDADFISVLNIVWGEYFSWTGRFPVQMTLYYAFSSGDTGLSLFNLLNALAFIGAVLLAVRLPGPLRPSVQLLVLVLYLALLWFTPHRLGELVLWKTGAIQYFWGVVLAAWIMKVVVDEVIWDRRRAQGLVVVALFGVACVIVGAWLENIAGAVAVVWLLVMNVQLRLGRRSSQLVWAGLVGWLIGTALLVLAPGNYERADLIGYLDSPFERILQAVERIFHYLHPAWLGAYLCFGILWRICWSPSIAPVFRRQLLTSLVFAAMAVASVISLVAAPVASWVGRVFTPFEVFMTFAVMAFFPTPVVGELLRSRWRYPLAGLLAGLMVAVMIDFDQHFRIYAEVHDQQEVRDRLVELARANGTPPIRVELPALVVGARSTASGTINEGRLFARDIGASVGSWKNACYAKAFGVDEVALAR